MRGTPPNGSHNMLATSIQQGVAAITHETVSAQCPRCRALTRDLTLWLMAVLHKRRQRQPKRPGVRTGRFGRKAYSSRGGDPTGPRRRPRKVQVGGLQIGPKSRL